MNIQSTLTTPNLNAAPKTTAPQSSTESKTPTPPNDQFEPGYHVEDNDFQTRRFGNRLLGVVAGSIAGAAVGNLAPSSILGGAGMAVAVGAPSAVLGGFGGVIASSKLNSSSGMTAAGHLFLCAAAGALAGGVMGGLVGAVAGSHFPAAGMTVAGGILGGYIGGKLTKPD